MQTTVIVGEIVIAGIGAIAWILLILCAVDWHICVKNVLEDYKDHSVLLVILALAISYVLGQIIDRTADFFLSKRLINTFFISLGKHIGKRDTDERKLEILVAEGRGSTYLDYIRGQVRIFRSASLNMFFITIACVAYFALQHTHNTLFIVAIAIGGAALVVGLLYLYSGVLATYEETLKTTNELTKEIIQRRIDWTRTL